MINLYQILRLSPQASRAEIEATLQRYRAWEQHEPKIVQAAESWLLVDEVRARYDARLRQEQPEFFQPARPVVPDDDYVVIEDDTPPPHSADTESDEYYVPLLWNPKAIAIWSFFLSPALGAWLQALNWRELGNEKAAQISMTVVWAVVGSSLGLAIITILTGWDWGFVLHIVVWAAWFVVLGRKQMDFVDNAVGDDYNRRTWQKPLGLTALAFVAYVIVVMVLMYLAIVMEWAHPSLFEV